MNVFFELFQELPRQGPGNSQCTKRAFELIPKLHTSPKILDVGCGTGFQTLDLARLSGGHITGLDNYKPFLEDLKKRAKDADLAENIEVVQGTMYKMDFDDESFNIIWAEGSIYIMGFERALKSWRRFLSPKGLIAASELSWLKDKPPKVLNDFWMEEYPGIKSIEENLAIIENCGYSVLGHFILPDSAWWDEFYTPMEKRIQTMRLKYKDDSKAMKIIENAGEEIQLFRKYSDWYGYVFYVMQKSE
jgi:ubiquinone/menaquinone biosynthesis C-methylase UbiE